MVEDIVSGVLTWVISTALLAPIVAWLLGRYKKIRQTRTLLSQLEEELHANQSLPRQAKSRPYDTYLSSAIVALDLSSDLREQLLKIDQGIRVIRSYVDRGITTSQTIESTFDNDLLPKIDLVIPLLSKERAKWERQRWWRPLDK